MTSSNTSELLWQSIQSSMSVKSAFNCVIGNAITLKNNNDKNKTNKLVSVNSSSIYTVS